MDNIMSCCNTDIQVNFVKTHDDAILPRFAKPGDAGADLFAVEDVTIEPGQAGVVPVGLTIGFITPGYWYRIQSRSGLGWKKGIQVLGGVMDNGYRGDLGVKLHNSSDKPVTIKAGEGAAQITFYKLILPEFGWTDTIEETERGKDGFGSTTSQG